MSLGRAVSQESVQNKDMYKVLDNYGNPEGTVRLLELSSGNIYFADEWAIENEPVVLMELMV